MVVGGREGNVSECLICLIACCAALCSLVRYALIAVRYCLLCCALIAVRYALRSLWDSGERVRLLQGDLEVVFRPFGARVAASAGAVEQGIVAE